MKVSEEEETTEEINEHMIETQKKKIEDPVAMGLQ